MSASLIQQYNAVVAQRNRLMLASLCLCVLCLLEACLHIRLMGKARTIVLPAQVQRAFWVSGDAVSDSYLEQMAQFLASLLLNVSPSTFALNSEQFLAQVSAQHFSAVKTQLVAQQLEIERLGMSSTFYAKRFEINQKALTADVQGELKMVLGNSPLPMQSKSYRLQFIREQGRLWLRSFEELKSNA